MKLNRISAFTLGVAITAFSVCAVSFASAASNATVRACADKKSGALRYISNGSCKRSETALSWSKTGPQGPPGPKGDTGATGTTTTVPGAQYNIGDIGPGGGTVFFVDLFNEYPFNYMEAAATENAPAKWCTSSFNTQILGTSTEFGTGYFNTIFMFARCTTSISLNGGGGKSDWFVPSAEEMNALKFNLHTPGKISLSPGFYCTSSMYDTLLNMYYLDATRNVTGNMSSDSECNVRLVRKF